MRTRTRFGLVAAVTATASIIAGSFVLAAPAAAATLDSTDFENGTTGAWTQNGGPTLEVVDLGKALQVANRSNDYDGIQLTTAVTAGASYALSAKVRLAEGTAGSAGVRFVAHEGDAYNWVGNTTMTADGWTTVTGTYTAAATGSMQFYLGTGAEVASPYTYLVDDLSITTDGGATVVSAVDFDNGDWAPWTQNGGPTLSAVGAGKVLQVANRSNDYDGIQLSAAVTAGTSYALSMRVRLAEGTAGSAGVRFVAHEGDAYNWVGNTTMTAAGWSTVAGTYTATASGTMQFYIGTGAEVASPYTYLVDDILITDGSGGGPGGSGNPGALSTGFESGLDGWGPRDVGGAPVVATTTSVVHGGAQAAAVTERDSQGDGIGHDASGLLVPGTTYTLSAWVRFAAGQPADNVWLSLASTTGTTTSYSTLGQFTGMSNSAWVPVSADFTVSSAESLFLYFETDYQGGAVGNSSDFFVDDIVVQAKTTLPIQDLTPIKDTVSFPVGVAIDSREEAGAASQLLLKHFDQVTSENYMKPEAWYAADKSFRIHPEAVSIMDFAQQHGLRVYGHTLVWHSQTPAWFFQDDTGRQLTSSAADQEILKQRMHDHIFDVAQALSDRYGPFGSATNPLVSFDVVNEAVDDSSAYADGLRRSPWYQVLGQQYLDLAFQYANEAFNDQYAAAGSSHPIELFINDYNTEQSGKQARFHAVVAGLLARGVPVDGVGHQFHVALSTPVAVLGQAIAAFEDLPVKQAVTEMDVTTGTPVSDAKLIDQGYYYRDAFRIFRQHASSIFSVTVWGLTDGRSWRSANGAPLVFDDELQAKPAYYGIVDGGELPAPLRTADVFQGDVPIVAGATNALAWKQLPLHPVGDAGSFQLRWAPDHLTAYVTVADGTANPADHVEFSWGDQTASFGRSGTGDVSGVAAATSTGYAVVVQLPTTGLAQGGTVPFDVRIVDGAETTGWNAPGVLGTLTLVEPVSYTEIPEASAAPVIDGTVDAVWAQGSTVTTDKQTLGTGGATALVHTIWKGSTLYVLAEVTDPTVDTSGSDPWIQDSVELYVDAGNVKNGSYRYDDTQLRISADNVVSFGTGDEAYQAGRLQSATARTGGGYLVEAAVSLLDVGGLGTFHGVDFQVNDASGGQRTGIRNWADPTGAGYQSTARWGVAQLVAGAPVVTPPALTLSATSVKPAGKVTVSLSHLPAGAKASLELRKPNGQTVATLATNVKAAADGTAKKEVTLPASVSPGAYQVVAVVGGSAVATADLTVAPSTPVATVIRVIVNIVTTILDLLKGLFGR